MAVSLLLALVLLETGALVSGQQVYLSLGLTNITTNNTEVLITAIGQDVSGGLPTLTCHTDLNECCRASDHSGTGGLGAWRYPDMNVIENEVGSVGENFFIRRNDAQLIRLNRRQGTNPLTPTGSFCCVIPTSGGEMTFCANIVVCLSLPPPTNGMISYNDSTLGVGSVATHSCDTGYTLNGGSTTRTCQSDGTWSGSAPTCENEPTSIAPSSTISTVEMVAMETTTIVATTTPVSVMLTTTPELPTTVEMTTSTIEILAVSSTASVSTAEALTTQSVSTTAVPTPSVTPTSSPTPAVIPTSSATLVSPSASSQAVLISPTMSPTPTAVDCGPPPSIDNGSPGTPTNTTFGGTVTYSCGPGYMLTGSATVACGASGSWSAVPACTIISCGSPPSIDNGSSGTPTNTTFGGTVTYSCTSGFTLVGSSQVTCSSTGNWSALPNCLMVTVSSISSTGVSIAGENYTLTCSADVVGSTATPTFQWLQDSTPLSTGDTRTSTAGGEPSSPYTSTLSFIPLQQSHSGTYTCRVTVDGVNSNSDTSVSVGVPSLTATLALDDSPVVGESFSLTCSVTGADSLDADISYQFIQDNPGLTDVVRGTQTTPTLTFNPLLLSDSGQYSCDVTVTSVYLDSPLMVSSDGAESLSIQIPTPNVFIPNPSLLYAGSSPQLSCTVTVDSSVVNVPASASVEWDGARALASSSGALVSGTVTLSTTLTDAMASDSGDYTCRATVSSTLPLAVTSSEGSALRAITIYPVPSAPTVSVASRTATSLTFSWSQSPGDSVTSYTLNLDYQGECTDFASIISEETVNGDVTEFTFGSSIVLEAFSDYQFTITASNPAGDSLVSSLTATTLPTAPSGRVGNLMVSSFNSTSITIQWDRVECVDRNSEITGYSVVYGPPFQTVMLAGTSTRDFAASSLFPGTEYTFQVTPTSDSGPGTSATLRETTEAVDDVTFLVGGALYGDHSLIRPDQFEDGSNALHCITPYQFCCRGSDIPGSNTGAGQWTTPDNTAVEFLGMNSFFYMSRNPSRVSLNRASEFSPLSGIYQCLIPGTGGSTEALHIGLYLNGSGVPSIEEELSFDGAALTLTCTSTGGPASEVVWTRNGEPVSTGYTLSQTVTDMRAGRYENVLSASDITDLVGNISCTVSNSRGVSNTVTIVITGVSIVSSPDLTVGESATLTCESVVSGLIEWLDSDMTVLSSGTGSSLNYTISTVSDSLHGSTLTCRGPGGSVSTTLSVSVPPTVLQLNISETGSLMAGSEYSLECEVSTTVSGLTNSPTAEWTVSGSGTEVSSTGSVSVLTFPTLSTFQGADYTCVGRLVSPALTEPLEIEQTQRVVVEIPTPGVSVTPPPSSLTAGTLLTLMCSITVNSAVDVVVVVDVTWSISTDTVPITSNSTASGLVPSFSDTLSIPVLSTRYTGVTCSARVRAMGSFTTITDSQEGRDTVSLTVQSPALPAVAIGVTGDSVAGSTLSLLCTATSPIPLVSPPVVSWVGVAASDPDIVTNSSSVSMASVTVTFDPLRTSHGRQYVCVAAYEIPEADIPSDQSTASHNVSVEIPPDSPTTLITRSPDGGELITEFNTGLELDLVCRLELDPAVDSALLVSRSWTKAGSSLSPDAPRLTISEAVRVQESPQVFESAVLFRTLVTDDSGDYECSLSVQPVSDTFITGTTTTASRTLAVEDFPVQTVQLSAEETVGAGESLSLTCVAGKDSSLSTATLEVEWLDSDGPLVTGGGGIVISGDTNTIDFTLSSTLTFPSITTSLAGPYTCRVNLTIPDADVMDHAVSRVSHVRVRIPPPETVVVSASRTAPLYEGTTGLVISCVVTPDNTGVDTDTVVMREITGPGADGSRASSSPQGETGTTLTISPLALSDDGLYTCTASVGSESNSEYILTSSSTLGVYNLTVRALPAPNVTIEQTPSVLAGSFLTLSCYVSVVEDLASPPAIQWTISSGDTVSSVLSGLNRTVTFDPVRTSDADQYTCSAVINIPEAGITDLSTSDSVELTVTIPPPTVTVTTPQLVYHGTYHTLNCVASYDMTVVDTPVTLVFSWTGPGGAALSSEASNITTSLSESSLTLTPVDQPSVSSGPYTCEVTVQSNTTIIMPGSSSNSVILNVSAAPAPLVESGVPVRSGRCGEVTAISCSASVLDNFATRPVITWQGPGNETVDNDETLDSNLMVSGEYTCVACVSIEAVSITGLCNTTAVNIAHEAPGGVTALSCSGSSGSVLEVEWGPPTGQAVLSYRVDVSQYEQAGGRVVTRSFQDNETLTERLMVTGLTPAVRYLVSVEAGSGSGCGSTVTEECYTMEGQPPRVGGVVVERLNGTAMNVSWTPLNKAEAGGFITEYIITYTVSAGGRAKRQSPPVKVPADQSSEVVGGLDPASQYDVTVMAENGNGTSPASPSVSSGATPVSPGSNIGIIVGVIIVVIVFIVVIIITIIIIMVLVRRHKGSKGQFKLSTQRNFELTNMESSGPVAPMAAHRRAELSDDLDRLDSVKAKEALAESDEVTPHAPTATSAEVLDRMKPISLTSFRSHVQNMHDDRAKGFEAEYQSFSLDPLEAHELAKIPHNRIKNRFANIFPYDHTRVLLKAIPGVDGSDYINACWMDGYQRKRCYIAAQGPMPNSLDDFWRMVWEYQLPNIVMLTKCKEGGRVKCEQYWAEDIGSVFETENKSVSVTTLSVTPFADFVIRQFSVKNSQDPSSEPLKVTQYHFTAWPDHGVPKFATSLISFIRKTQRGHNKDKSPLLVHCSAGVGRTGTFITLDSMLERIHKETSVNVYAFVKHMRTERVLMVQTLAQYSFIHDALDELITCGETDIPAGSLRTKFKVLSKLIPGKGVSGFYKQFQLLGEVSRVPEEEDVTDANEPYNKDKNRYPDKVPYNMSRARLRPTGEDGSEYINASFVDGYKQRNAYIATQGPLKHTVADFWRMLWEFKSKTVVMLCNSEEHGEESAHPYWPAKENETTIYGKINVTLQSKAAYGDFSVRKFTIIEEKPSGGKQMEGFTVTQFHHTEWPRDSRPKSGTLIEMLDMITKSQMSTGNRPITVMCNDGVGRTGTFICLHAQLERLKTEGVVDFFQSIKSARIQRAGLVPDVAGYSYCHEVLADYIDKFDNYANFKDMI